MSTTENPVDLKPVALMHRGLPKWPQMYVTGKPVTLEQAKEIIRRTDYFFLSMYGGNNQRYNKKVRTLLGMPNYSDWEDESIPRYGDGKHTEEQVREHYRKQHAIAEAFKERWQVITTSYVHNVWISCAFIGGPHGWCHPDGVIGFVDNVGKWPSVEEIYNEWTTLAQAFPFLDIGVTLKDGESCEETKPVVSLRVRGGQVTLVDPAEEDVHKDHPEGHRRTGESDDTMGYFKRSMAYYREDHEDGAESHENGIEWSWFREWAKQYPAPKEG